MSQTRKPGRPKAVIDWNKVNQMLMAQCDGVEIAEWLGINPETLYDACLRVHNIGFSEYSQQKKAKGVAHAKQAFFNEAFINPEEDPKSKTTKQIFWMKNNAGWSEKKEVKAQVDSAVTVVELPSNGTSPQSKQIDPDWDK